HIQLENRTVADHALVVQPVRHREHIRILRHRDLLDSIVLYKGEYVVGDKNCRQRQHDRDTQHRNDIYHRTRAAAVLAAPAAPAALRRLGDALRLLIDVVIHIVHDSTSYILVSGYPIQSNTSFAAKASTNAATPGLRTSSQRSYSPALFSKCGIA